MGLLGTEEPTDLREKGEEKNNKMAAFQEVTVDPQTYLVDAGGVVEFAQRCLVAVGHVIAPTEEHQGAAVVRQGAPVHIDTALLLGRERGTRDEGGSRVCRCDDESASHLPANYQ